MSGYFSKFPTINYDGSVVTDITRRVAISDSIAANPRAWQPLEVRDGYRPDRVAEKYYGDPYMSWLVLTSAGVVDPYYGWRLDDFSFSAFIDSKYGSQANALGRVHHWSLNWFGNADATITPTAYSQVILSQLQKYYTPVLGPGGRPLYYALLRADWTVTTNMIVGVGLANASGSFLGGQTGESVVFSANSGVFGNAQVAWANSTYMLVEHVQGNVSAANCNITGLETDATALLANSTVLTLNIPQAEQVFWGPVSCYDYERDKNEKLKSVKIVDATFSMEASRELANTLTANVV